MEASILALLARHESLGFDQILAHLAEPPDAVRSALTDGTAASSPSSASARQRATSRAPRLTGGSPIKDEKS